MDAVFLSGSLDEAGLFVGFGTHPRFDVWLIDVTGLVLEPGPEGWLIHRHPIPPHRLRLVQKDVQASPAPASDPSAAVEANA